MNAHINHVNTYMNLLNVNNTRDPFIFAFVGVWAKEGGRVGEV